MTFQKLRPSLIGTQTRRILVMALGLILAACQTAPIEDAGPISGSPKAAEVIEPRQSPNDQRSYRYLTLDNKLQVLLVSDPDTDKSAAALSVYRGRSPTKTLAQAIPPHRYSHLASFPPV